MAMLRKTTDDQLKHLKKIIAKKGGDISKKVKDKYTKITLDHPIDLSDDEPNANMKTDKHLKNLSKNSLITKFENYTKMYESKTEFFGLPPTLTVDDLSNNISNIVSQYANREMAFIQCSEYINEFPIIAKQYLTDKNIKTSEEFKKHLKVIQAKVRSGKRKRDAENDEKFKKIKSDLTLSNIEQMGKTQEDDMQRQIAEFDFIENALKAKFGENARYITGIKMNPDREAVIAKAKKDFKSLN